ncbi:MAG: hypothetical protein J4452_03550 [Candidatus Aenigmarchaeota archaeon]|nr:hypothetical protein [Candidatus Aenigmarchaeota archaeon]
MRVRQKERQKIEFVRKAYLDYKKGIPISRITNDSQDQKELSTLFSRFEVALSFYNTFGYSATFNITRGGGSSIFSYFLPTEFRRMANVKPIFGYEAVLKGSSLTQEDREARKLAMLDYIKEHHDVTRKGIVKAGFSVPFRDFYNRRINDARRDAGIPPVPGLKKLSDSEWELRRQKLLDFYREHPTASYDNFVNAGLRMPLVKFYGDSIRKFRQKGSKTLDSC